MQPGEIKIFTKSGNKVRLLERDGSYRNHPNVMDWCWVVERVDGESKGKQMTCPERALVDADSYYSEG